LEKKEHGSWSEMINRCSVPSWSEVKSVTNNEERRRISDTEARKWRLGGWWWKWEDCRCDRHVNERREKQSFLFKYIAHYLWSEKYIPGSRRRQNYFDRTLHKTSTGSSYWLVSPVIIISPCTAPGTEVARCPLPISW
jgi:hypothetical protein